ncbi:MAG: response regulator transcription factor [Synechococcales cyanobacterium K44_A2020_017]|jgi:DNA-binding NarL/FixJ family response regulator|nr:response regulator transcription factor [Synechococcales cyanobacterium K32_A2020_035]MBF2094107.1 response regulator transcription factor [Synechococcales cyanobacterium K44_A2020_017]
MTPIRVALVEDHALTRMGLKATLEQYDTIAVVGDAKDGRTGLQMLQRTQPDVALIDIGLPDFDGIELIRQFQISQAEVKAPPVKLVILTMHDDEDAVLAAFGAGADSYCMKDVQVEQLMEAIQATAAGQAWIDPAIANIILRNMRQSFASMGNAAPGISIMAADPEYKTIIDTFPLTERELEILELIVAGGSNAKIASALDVTVGTIKTHVRHILSKLCADDRTQAAVRALRSGLVC